MMRGYNFTEHVRRALAMSREEAHRLNHEYVGTEHMLLGLLFTGDDVTAELIARGLTVERVEQGVAEEVARIQAQRSAG